MCGAYYRSSSACGNRKRVEIAVPSPPRPAAAFCFLPLRSAPLGEKRDTKLALHGYELLPFCELVIVVSRSFLTPELQQWHR